MALSWPWLRPHLAGPGRGRMQVENQEGIRVGCGRKCLHQKGQSGPLGVMCVGHLLGPSPPLVGPHRYPVCSFDLLWSLHCSTYYDSCSLSWGPFSTWNHHQKCLAMGVLVGQCLPLSISKLGLSWPSRDWGVQQVFVVCSECAGAFGSR